MSPELKERLAKVYELVKNGATEGERKAARLALDRILKKFDLEGVDLDSLNRETYYFKYSTDLEHWLLVQIVKCLVEDDQAIKTAMRSTNGVREIRFSLKHLDYITVSASYEYFRRHMKAQWNKVCAKEVAKKRKAKTRNARRDELKDPFFVSYVMASNLYKKEQLEPAKNLNEQEKADFRMMEDVQGGKYNTQLNNGLMLEQGQSKSKEQGQLSMF